MIPSINYHLLRACNMACNHCFAANVSDETLALEDSVRLVGMLAEAKFEKINFAGGEPLLHTGLDRLIHEAKGKGMTTSIVTNGTRLTGKWLDGAAGSLDWVAISMDSADPDTHKASGRAQNGRAVPTPTYMKWCQMVLARGIRLKINTVVTVLNHAEDMASLIEEMNPERWKVMQALPILGQNDHNAGTFEATDEQFKAFVERNGRVKNVQVIPESNRQMTGSYAMIDPRGCFFDNTRGTYTYSRPILEVGVKEAHQDVSVYPDRFDERGGRYVW